LVHAEINALKETFGISYKDAAHRLFLTEVERVQKADSAAKAFAVIRKRLDGLVNEEICAPISAIDKGEFDDYVLRNGEWMMKSEGSGFGKGVQKK
jgi:hypothetical protein